jgi:hypothetical protein
MNRVHTLGSAPNSSQPPGSKKKAAMQHEITVPDEIGRAVEAFAEEEGLSVSEFYAEAAKKHLQRLRRQRAAKELKRRAGTIEFHGDVDEALREIREEGKGRV